MRIPTLSRVTLMSWVIVLVQFAILMGIYLLVKLLITVITRYYRINIAW